VKQIICKRFASPAIYSKQTKKKKKKRMQITKSIETPEGTVKFTGEISGAELDIVLQMGLLTLMSRGVIQAVVADKDAEENLH